MDLSIIIVSYNTKDITLGCLRSVAKHTKGINYEIIVVDNASKDGSSRAIGELGLKNLKLIKNKKNAGFGAANNQGAGEAGGEYLLFLNSDTLVGDNAIGEAVFWLKARKNVGAMSVKLLNPDGTTQATGGYFPTLPRVFSWMTIQDFPLVDKFIKPFHPLKERSFVKEESFFESRHQQDWIKGAFMLTPKKVFKKAGGFDTDYFMYTEDVDLCFRIKKLGHGVYYEPKWSIAHLGGASAAAGEHLVQEYDGIKTFYKKHYPAWQLPLLRMFLKVGAVGRMVLFGILNGKEDIRIYAKAFRKA